MRLPRTTNHSSVRPEHLAVLELVGQNSTVLDLGCGKGELLSLLVKERRVKGQGIEIDEQAIYECVARGLSVCHGDIDTGLSEYKEKSFDYVILCQSFQQVRKPDVVLKEALRVGKEVIVSFPNFGHYRVRLQICFNGKTPVTPSLPYQWYDTPNLHFLTVSDFIEYCGGKGIKIMESVFLGERGRFSVFPNLFAEVGIFRLTSDQSRT